MNDIDAGMSLCAWKPAQCKNQYLPDYFWPQIWVIVALVTIFTIIFLWTFRRHKSVNLKKQNIVRSILILLIVAISIYGVLFYHDHASRATDKVIQDVSRDAAFCAENPILPGGVACEF